MAPGIRLLLVDALNLIRRIYAAQDGEDRVREARESSVRSLRRALTDAEPTHVAVVFDGTGPTWRHELHPEYKSGHKAMPDELAAALPAFRDAFAGMGLASVERPATEADDVIATLAVKVTVAGGRALVLSTDRGYLQLLAEGVAVRDHFRHLDLGPHHVRERFGVGPERLLDLLALAGDTSSSIPGVRGIGPKTAAALLDSRGSLDAVFDAATRRAAGEARPPGDALTPRLAARIVAHAEDARLSRRLAALRTDLELGLNLRDLRRGRPSEPR